jgi:A/G-specific adenine glycosylase
MELFPSIEALAAASRDDVLSAWRGLGYYSRAVRVHEAAQVVVNDATMDGLLPADVAELEGKVPGVGRYTAGAISSIVFGRSAAMVDGNVLRVLSRQMGIYGSVKDKKVVDAVWTAAERLVQQVAKDVDDASQEEAVSDRPGRWGQALMELGSTICTPKPSCAACPITTTCRAFTEGQAMSRDTSQEPATVTTDVEDLCILCDDFEEEMVTKKTQRQNGKKTQSSKKSSQASESESVDIITDYVRRFPTKTIKKAVRQEETLVCAIRSEHDNTYLIHRRPDKGLLAGLWELPSLLLSDSEKSTAQSRQRQAKAFASKLAGTANARYCGELGTIPWLFSHIKLTMHVYLFVLEGPSKTKSTDTSQRWESSKGIDKESMGTGMRKCWALVKEEDDM